MVYRSVNISLYAYFSHYYHLAYCRRICCGPVDVASMSGALISGAHENMPERVVDDRAVVVLCFTSSQVVYVNAIACLKTTNKICHTPDTEETRPEDSPVYRQSGSGYRTAHLIFTSTLHSTEDTTAMRWTQCADAQNQLQRW